MAASKENQAFLHSRFGLGRDPLEPYMLSFLGFLEQQMRKHPDRIQPLDPELLDEIGDLVRGVRAA